MYIKKCQNFTVFQMRFGLFEYVIIFFELCDGLVLFQHYINNILKKYLDIFCITYFNDILIYSKNEFEYKIYIRKILN